MALITPDFSEAADGVPAGTYSAHIVKWEEKDSKAGPKTMVRWQFTVFNAPEAKYNGQSVWTNTMVVGKGASMLQKLYRAAMGTDVPLNTAGKPELDPDHLLGKTVSIVVTDGIDRSTGEKTGYAEVKAIKALVAAA